MVTHGYLTTLNYIRVWMIAVRIFRSTSAFLCELTPRLSGIFYSMELYLHVLLIWCPHHIIWGHKTRELVCVCLYMATLTEVLYDYPDWGFSVFFLSCKANSRVKPAKTGHGPHSSWFLCCSMYYLFCVVLCTVCMYMCTVLLPPGGYAIAVNKYNHIICHVMSYHISYHVMSYHIISYILSYIISCHVLS
jgi:hypothetical protein